MVDLSRMGSIDLPMLVNWFPQDRQVIGDPFPASKSGVSMLTIQDQRVMYDETSPTFDYLFIAKR